MSFEESIGCTYSYNEEKTPEMESFDAARAFNPINVDLYRLLKPGYHLIHEISITPARASIIGDFGFQTTKDCVPEIVMVGPDWSKHVIGHVKQESDVFRTILDGRIGYSGSWSWNPEEKDANKGIYIHFPAKNGCRFILEHASITFYRSKDDVQAFSSQNCPVGAQFTAASVSRAFNEYLESSKPTGPYVESFQYIETYYEKSKDVTKALEEACATLSADIMVDDPIHPKTSSISAFHRWYQRQKALGTVFTQPNPAQIIDQLQKAPVMQTFFDLRRYHFVQQVKEASSSIRSALQPELAKFNALQVYVMTFLDAYAETEDRRGNIELMMGRACQHLSKIVAQPIDCTKMSFNGFQKLFERNIIGVSTLPEVPAYPKAKQSYELLNKALNSKQKATMMSLLDQDLNSVRIVDAFFYFSSYSFSHVYARFSPELKTKYYDKMQDWTAVVSFIGIFLDKGVYPPNYDRVQQATETATTGACAFLPGSLDPTTVSIGTFSTLLIQYTRPWNLPPVPTFIFAKHMYKRFETFTFRRFIMEPTRCDGPLPSLDASTVEIFFRTVHRRLAWQLGNSQFKQITRFLMIFLDAKVEGKGIGKRALVEMALYTTERACAFLISLGSPAIDYRTISGAEFLKQMDALVTEEALKTVRAPTERAKRAYEHYEATLTAKRRNINT